MLKTSMVLLVACVLLVGCGGTLDTAKMNQLNNTFHAYPDAAEAWLFIPADASVYAEQRFGIGRTAWLMMHLEKKQGEVEDGVDEVEIP